VTGSQGGRAAGQVARPVTGADDAGSVTGADGAGIRRARIGDVALETGQTLPGVILAFESWGTLNADASNAVLIQHALTGSSHVARGATDEDGWWEGLVGPGRAIDTDRYFVVAANILGGCYGTTGPASTAPDGRPWGSRFPFTTVRDSVRAEAALADLLGIRRWYAVLGGSLGGARALEWAACYPDRVARCVVVAACAASTAEQIAFGQAQLLAIRQDPHFAGGDYYGGAAPAAGLGLARRIAHVTYRSETDFQARFGRGEQPGESPVSGARLGSPRGSSHDSAPGGGAGGAVAHRYQVESYLDYQAEKLVRRFDANSYVVITEALMSHDVARGRGTLRQALAATAGVEFLVAAVTSDRLYFPAQSVQLAAALPGAVEVAHIDSPIGHDGFLTETDALGGILRRGFFPA
jgi:homoserine O-acetyltransferase